MTHNPIEKKNNKLSENVSCRDNGQNKGSVDSGDLNIVVNPQVGTCTRKTTTPKKNGIGNKSRKKVVNDESTVSIPNGSPTNRTQNMLSRNEESMKGNEVGENLLWTNGNTSMTENTMNGRGNTEDSSLVSHVSQDDLNMMENVPNTIPLTKYNPSQRSNCSKETVNVSGNNEDSGAAT